MFYVADVFANQTGMSVLFVMENLSCAISLVNRCLKISGKLVSGPLLVHVLGLLCCLKAGFH